MNGWNLLAWLLCAGGVTAVALGVAFLARQRPGIAPGFADRPMGSLGEWIAEARGGPRRHEP